MPSQRHKTVVDANVILRYLLRDSENLYKEAETFFGKVIRGEELAYIPDAVIAEVVYVLEKNYKVSREEISDVLVNLIQINNISIVDKHIIIKAFDVYSRRKIDFVDCLICAYSEDYEVISFDRDVSKCVSSLKR